MRRLDSKLPSFSFPFWVQSLEYLAEVNPTAMLVTIRRNGEVRIPFNIDETKGKAVLVPPATFPSFLGEGVDPNEVTDALQAALTLHLVCPECGCCADEGKGFDDNGLSSTSVAYSQLCLKCNYSWDPNDG